MTHKFDLRELPPYNGIRATDLFGKEDIWVPQNYQVVGFRIPGKDEPFIGAGRSAVQHGAGDLTIPQIVLVWNPEAEYLKKVKAQVKQRIRQQRIRDILAKGKPWGGESGIVVVSSHVDDYDEEVIVGRIFDTVEEARKYLNCAKRNMYGSGFSIVRVEEL